MRHSDNWLQNIKLHLFSNYTLPVVPFSTAALLLILLLSPISFPRIHEASQFSLPFVRFSTLLSTLLPLISYRFTGAVCLSFSILRWLLWICSWLTVQTLQQQCGKDKPTGCSLSRLLLPLSSPSNTSQLSAHVDTFHPTFSPPLHVTRSPCICGHARAHVSPQGPCCNLFRKR